MIYDIKDLGHIYVLTSPSGNQYVGQTICFYKNGKKKGYLNRWKEHIYESRSKKPGCYSINRAIEKYGPDKFHVRLLEITPYFKLNEREIFWIEKLNTLSPCGYNLKTGSTNGCRLSEETKIKIRDSNIGKNKGKLYDKKVRIREEDSNLPKYISSYHDSRKEGYRISHHPILKNKTFASNKLTMDEKLQLATNYLNGEEEDIEYLPQYVYPYNEKGVNTGFAIRRHPSLKDTKFISMKISMEEKFDLAIKYLQSE